MIVLWLVRWVVTNISSAIAISESCKISSTKGSTARGAFVTTTNRRRSSSEAHRLLSAALHSLRSEGSPPRACFSCRLSLKNKVSPLVDCQLLTGKEHRRSCRIFDYRRPRELCTAAKGGPFVDRCLVSPEIVEVDESRAFSRTFGTSVRGWHPRKCRLIDSSESG